MHTDSACVAPRCQLLLGVTTSERDVVVGLAPIHVARRRRVAFFNVKTAGETYVPVVVPLNEVRLEGPVCVSVGCACISTSLGDVVGKSRTPASLATESSAATVRLATTAATATSASVRIPTLCAAVTAAAMISDIIRKRGGNESVACRRGPIRCARVVGHSRHLLRQGLLARRQRL